MEHRRFFNSLPGRRFECETHLTPQLEDYEVFKTGILDPRRVDPFQVVLNVMCVAPWEIELSFPEDKVLQVKVKHFARRFKKMSFSRDCTFRYVLPEKVDQNQLIATWYTDQYLVIKDGQVSVMGESNSAGPSGGSGAGPSGGSGAGPSGGSGAGPSGGSGAGPSGGSGAGPSGGSGAGPSGGSGAGPSGGSGAGPSGGSGAGPSGGSGAGPSGGSGDGGVDPAGGSGSGGVDPAGGSGSGGDPAGGSGSGGVDPADGSGSGGVDPAGGSGSGGVDPADGSGSGGVDPAGGSGSGGDPAGGSGSGGDLAGGSGDGDSEDATVSGQLVDRSNSVEVEDPIVPLNRPEPIRILKPTFVKEKFKALIDVDKIQNMLDEIAVKASLEERYVLNNFFKVANMETETFKAQMRKAIEETLTKKAATNREFQMH